MIYLENGFYSVPYKFTNSKFFFYLRLQQVAVSGFIDNVITLGRSFIEYERNIKLVITLSCSLGLVAHPDKPIFVSAKSIKYLGFVNDSQSMTVSLTQKKKSSIKQLCQEML